MTDEKLPGEKKGLKWLIFVPLLLVLLIVALIVFPLQKDTSGKEGQQTEEAGTVIAEKKISDAELKKQLKQIVRAQISGEEGALMEELRVLSPSDAENWDELLAYWKGMSESGFVNICEDDATAPLPEGLPEDDSLCIVVLGFQLNTDGTMREELEKRMKVGLAAAEQYPQAYICVTGGHTASGNRSASEGGVMASWLLSHGLPDERIIRETESRTTVENAVFCQRIFRESYPQIKTVAIVTSDYHIKLGSLLFNSRFITQGQKKLRVVANAANRTGGNYCFTPEDEAYWLSDLLNYD